jgi:NAD-dependent SIR2 family protein deacetylase
MPSTVLFLGAGASKEAGAPMVGDLPKEIERAGTNGEIPVDVYQRFRRLCDEAGRDFCQDIEKLLQWADGHAEDPEGKLQIVSEAITETLALRPLNIRSGMPHVTDLPYKRLVEKLRVHGREIAMVTLNYDVFADVAIYNAGWKPYYCLNRARGAAGDEVPIAKLHGSLNWHGCLRCGRVNASPHIDEFTRIHLAGRNGQHVLRFKDWGEWSRDARCSCGRREQQPLIVPPVENKSRFTDNLAVIWGHAEELLGKAETILVAGYSFRSIDRAVNNLLANPDGCTRNRIKSELCKASEELSFEEFDDFFSALGRLG